MPDEVEPRIARQIDAMAPMPPEHLPPLFLASMPPAVALDPTVFERPDVRRAEVAGVGGIFTARSEARFWAMLANGGELDGVRLLSQRARGIASARRARTRGARSGDVRLPDPDQHRQASGSADRTRRCARRRNPRAICHPGQGGSIGWADPDLKLAVAICHNRLFNPTTLDEDAMLVVANAVREALGLE